MLTKFPNLFTSAEPPLDSGDDFITCSFRAGSISREAAILAGAQLLKSYTGCDEVVLFVDDECLEVDLNGMAIVASSFSGPRGSRYLSLRTSMKSNGHKEYSFSDQIYLDDKPALLCEVNLVTGEGEVKCSSFVPANHVFELARQFEAAIASTLHGQLKESAVNLRPTCRMSVMNPNPKNFQGPQLLHQLLGKHSKSGTIAVEHAGPGGECSTVTYQHLESCANRLATRLRAILDFEGDSNDSTVIIPVLLPQSPELYVSLVGILKAGAAFCPLNLDAPKERVDFILNDVCADTVITSSTYQDLLPIRSGLSICTVDDCLTEFQFEPPYTWDDPSPEQFAYVMYTSGSTGKPKGVSVSHFAVTQSLLAHDSMIPQFSRFLQFAAPTFDVSVFEIFFTFWRGSTLVSCDRRQLLDELPETINRLEIDAAELTPTVAGSLLTNRAQVPHLKLLLTIGEMLTKPVIDQFGGAGRAPSIMYGMYGPTEAAIHSTLQPEFLATMKTGIIGRPLDSVSVFILASVEDCKPQEGPVILPYGHIGELALGGCQLANGYLNRPEQTRLAFISSEYGLLYRTGDKARFLPDGMIECLGRMQAGQVKLRGQRVELGEVEEVVSRSNGCRLASASIIKGVLVVFCLIGSENILKEEIFSTCRRWLPSSMIPGDVILLRSFPHLSSGKIDKRKLEEDYENIEDDLNQLQDTEDSQLEMLLSLNAEEVLTQSIGKSASFAAAGLDSLLAIRLASKIRSHGYRIGALDILSTDSIEKLALLMEQQSKPGSVQSLSLSELTGDFRDKVLRLPAVQMHSSAIVDILPCTPLQMALLSETSANSQAYCNSIELAFSNTTTIEGAMAAIGDVVQRNEILRTGFVALTDSPVPWAQVLFGDIESQIYQVETFGRHFQVSETISLIRPLEIQINTRTPKIKLLIRLHHALYDGWSVELILKDLDAHLQLRNHGTRPQFREVVRYYESLPGIESMHVARRFWTGKVLGFEPTPFPNLSGNRVDSTQSSVQKFKLPILPEELTAPEHCRAFHAQTILQAAVAYLLSSYYGTTDICFGSVTSGRTIPVTGIEDVIGPCIATLPMRTQVTPSLTVNDFLQAIHVSGREMLMHSILPLRDIKAIANVRPGQHLFDVLCIWQETLESSKNALQEVELIDSMEYLEFKLVLEFEPQSDGIEIQARFQESWIPSAQNPEPQILGSKDVIASYVEKFAKLSPESPAISIGALENGMLVERQSIDYSSLNKSANQLANFLLKAGVEAGNLVCVMMEKSVNLYIAILAVSKTGSGYLPITPETPENRVAVILHEAGCRVCLVDRSHPTLVEPGKGLEVFNLNQMTHKLNNQQHSAPIIPFDLESPAYAIFTSGSTGRPKGILVTQRNIASNIETLTEVYPISKNARVLQACSQAFDVSVFEIFFTWYSGACLCTASNDVLFRDLEESIRNLNITHLSLTPTAAALVDAKNVPDVKFLVTAGEPLTENVHRNWSQSSLFNGYGPAETTNICAVNPMRDTAHLLNNVGPPLKNTSAFVVSDAESHDLKLMPSGALGELCFGGDQVFKGYLKMSQLTSNKIVDHPHFGRIYRSGDIGRILHDGSILVYGRMDDQVKIRGQRVELGEIAGAIMQSSIVQACTVVAIESSQQQQLVGFWVPSIESAISPHMDFEETAIAKTNKSLFDLLKTLLPTYMVPTALMPVKELLLTSQGKVDKRGLTKTFRNLDLRHRLLLSSDRQVDDRDQEWSELEHGIVSALASVLNLSISTISRGVSFFGLGLDSINAIALGQKLRNITQSEVAISTILRNPTVALLAVKLESDIERSTGNSPSPKLMSENFLDANTFSQITELFRVNGRTVEKILPCTPLQEATLLASSSSGVNVYCNQMHLKLVADIRSMKDCWIEMVSRHAILRTCFMTSHDPRFGFFQVVLTEDDLHWEEIRTPKTISDHYLEFCMNVAAKSIDSCQSPYLLTAFTCEQSYRLLISIHHALYDAEAMSQLLADVEQRALGEALPPAVSPDLFLAYALSPNLEAGDLYWHNLLKGFATQGLPKSSIEPAGSIELQPEIAVKVTTKTLSTPLGRIENAARWKSVTLLSLCQSAWTKVLLNIFGTSDVCFGNVMSGRTLPLDGISQLVFPCFNTVPVRILVDSEMSNDALAKALNRQNASSLEHQFTPLRRIQSQWRRNNNVLFETLFLLQRPKRHLNRQVWSLVEESGDTGLSIVCELDPDPSDNTMRINLHYQVNLWCKKDADIVISLFDSAVLSLMKNPDGLAEGFHEVRAEKLVQSLKRQLTKNSIGSPNSPQLSNDSKTDHGEDERFFAIRKVYSVFSGVAEDLITPRKTIFQLGLDSINAIQIAKILREKGISVSGQDIMENPAIGDLSSCLGRRLIHVSSPEFHFDFTKFEQRHLESICEQHQISKSKIKRIRPCTPVQAGIVAQFLHSGGMLYFNHMEWDMSSTVDVTRMLAAWKMAAEKHPMLRTGFATIDDSMFSFAMIQYKDSNPDIPFTVSERDGRTLKDLRQSLSLSVFENLEQPPWRISILRSVKRMSIQLSILHALYDAQTLGMILADVEAIYDGRKRHPLPPMDPLLERILEPTQGAVAQNRAFWQEAMEGMSISRFPSLITSRVIDGIQCSKSLVLSIGMKSLEETCQRLDLSIQIIFQATWAILLSSYHGEDQLTFGIVLSGRSTKGADGVAFPCSTIVPLPCRNISDKACLLQSLKTFNASVLKHQFTPLSQIQRWSHNPEISLFDSILVYQGLERSQTNGENWTLVEEEASVEYPISIEVETCSDDNVKVNIVFRNNLIPSDHASIMLRQFDVTFLALLSERRSSAPYAIELLSRTPPKIPLLPSPINLLHGFVEDAAERHPARVALEFVSNFSSTNRPRRWNYQELDSEANKIANLIIKSQIPTRSLIAICFDKCPEASFAILGILKAGCAFVAVDHTSPVARQAFVVEDSNARLVLTSHHYVETLREILQVPVYDAGYICSDSVDNFLIQPAVDVTKDDTCYCLYTSGSTGTPKGCLISHENAVQFVLAFQRIFAGHWEKCSRFLQFASFHFDVSIMEQFFSWSIGICVVSAPRDLIFIDLADALRRLEITHIDLTPSLAKLITPEEVPSLCRGVFITGGEQLKQEILDAWGPTGVIYNGYGPTECTIGCTMYPRVPNNGKPSNIGWPYSNAGTYVLKPGTTDIVLKGAIGELCISGKLVGRGYLNRSELTRERFPFIEHYGERIYRTGDLVRLLHDGSFDFLGRIDDQVKLRGQRLEIGEITSVILNFSPVRDATVAVMTFHGKQTEHLVAFVVPDKKTQWTPRGLLAVEDANTTGNILEHCRQKLPSYMVPSQVILLRSIPLTVNNKIDMKTLRELYGLHHDRTGADEHGYEVQSADMSEDETKIANTLANSFNIPLSQISSRTNIFEAGLDSISVFGFAKALKHDGFSKAKPSTLMQSNTVAELARSLAGEDLGSESGSVLAAKQDIAACQHRYRTMASEYLKIDVEDIESIAPCTPLQQGIIARSLVNNNSLYYNSFVFDLPENTDLGKLKTAWEGIFKTTQILRTCFLPIEDGYIQVVLSDMRFPWNSKSTERRVELGDISHSWHKEWCSMNTDIISCPFELRIASTGYRTILVVHLFHALYDANSLAQIFQAVEKRYSGANVHINSPNFHAVLPYGPLRRVGGAKEFWTRYMKDAPFHQVPSFGLDKIAGDTCMVLYATKKLPQLETVRRQLGVTHQAIVQACWMAVLQNYFKAPTTIGIVVSGRSFDYEGVWQTIGPFFNTLPFYLLLDQHDSWKSAIRACHNFNMSALPYQQTPLHDIAKWCHMSKHQSMFQSLLVFRKGLDNQDTNTNLFRNQIETLIKADYPISFEAEHMNDDNFKLTIVAMRHIADHRACEGLLHHFQDLLGTVVDCPELPIEATENEIVRVTSSKTPAKPHVHDPQGLNGDVSCDDVFEGIEIGIRDEIAALAGVEKNTIRRHSSIFELGLDSIDAIKLSTRLKKKNITLKVSSIMQNPDISFMAEEAKISSVKDKSEESTSLLQVSKLQLKNYLLLNGIGNEGIENVLPATPLQEAMVAEMFASDFENYFNHDVLRLAPEINLQRLKKSFDTVFRGSPILRTTFLAIDDPNIDCAFAQVIHQGTEITLKEASLPDLDHIGSLLSDIRTDALNYANKYPPIRLTILSIADTKYIVFSISHALYDGWSLSLLHADVRKAYNGSYSQRPSYELPLETIMRECGSSAESFWRNALAGSKGCNFPTRITKANPKTGTMHRKVLNSSLPLNHVSNFCRTQRVTLQALAQTCWSCVLSSYTHTLDVVFGVVLSGRQDEDDQQALFPVMNTVALRAIIHGTRAEMLQYMQSTLSEVIQYQHFPLRKVQNLAKLGGKGLFNTLFIYQKYHTDEEEYAALYETIDIQADVEYPVCVEIEIVSGQLTWQTACRDDRLSESQTNQLLEQLDLVLKEVVERPQKSSITFANGTASICGLPPFKMRDAVGDNEFVTSRGQPFAESPWTMKEQVLRDVLGSISGVPVSEITKSQNIFHLGLDSISAIKVVGGLRKRGVSLKVSDMVKAQTIGQICLFLEHEYANGDENNNVELTLSTYLQQINTEELTLGTEIKHEDITSVLPSTSGQVYFLTLWDNSHGAVFLPCFTYKLSGTIGIPQLREAWRRLLQLEPLLRTVFLATGRSDIPFIQVVLKYVRDSLRVVAPDSRFSAVERPNTDFSLPPVHMTVVHSDKETTLHLQLHHALYDAVSLPLLIRKLEALCNGRSPSLTSNNTGSYADFLALTASSAALNKRKEFWTEYLRGLAASRPHLPISSAHALRTEVFKPHLISFVGGLISLSKQNGLTLPSLFLAVFAPLYASICKPGPRSSASDSQANDSEDTVIGFYLANRSHALLGLETLAAPTVNIIPLRIRSPFRGNVLEQALEFQQDLQAVSSVENASVGLWEIYEWTGVRVSCVVNFLRLPEDRDVESGVGGGGDGIRAEGDIRIREVVEGRRVERAEVVEEDLSWWEEQPALARNNVKDAYLPSIDVEVAVRSDGLDVGIFSPTRLLGIDEAEKLVSGLKERLLSLV